MIPYYVDTHCHLDLIQNIEKNPNVENDLPIKSITVTNAPFLYQPNVRLFEKCINIRVALGMHPELIINYKDQISIFEQKIKDTKYIGEIGLDGSERFKNSFKTQLQVFQQLLNIIKREDNKVITIHSRGAAKESIDTLNSSLKGSNCIIILHWYSGNLSELRKALNFGFYFSINHKMLQNPKGIEIIKNIPLNFLLTETDAPFTLNNTSFNRVDSLKETVKGISKIHNMSEEEVKFKIYSNFKSILSIVT